MLRRRLCGGGALALAGGVAQAQGLTLQTASQEGVPFKFDLRNTAQPGICIEIVRALERFDPGLHFAGLEREMPLRRIESELAAGSLDVFLALIRTPEREAALHFLAEPMLYAVHHQVPVRAGDTVSVETLDDIRRLGRDGIILTTQGTAYPQFLDGHAGLIVDKSSNHNGHILKMLLAGRGRFFYQGDSTLRHQIQADGLGAQMRILPAVFKTDEQLVAHAPQLPAAKLARLQRALDLLQRSGELVRMRGRYGLY